MRRRWLNGSVGLMTVIALAGCSAGAEAVDVKKAAQAQKGTASPVAERLRETIDRLRFEEVLDTAPPGSAQARALRAPVDKEATQSPRQRARLYAAAEPKPIVQQPQMDATIIELDRNGRPVSSGTVLMSPLYKDGVVVPVDRNLSTTSVRWRQWDDAGWYANKGQGSIDVVAGRENAPLDHMLNYPASVLKLMVNFGVLRLVDQGKIKLDDTFDYRPTSDSSVSLCGTATSKTVRQYMDESLTWSSNGRPAPWSSCSTSRTRSTR
ncbi:hypothetical protein ABZ801_09830 [Actinomadura sp. NPDC047616]|uniref:hypothetical protein n=1 Tax=Actinomadura sp. NPDC047616 TaxID=3155914 RepID=UPI0033D0AEDA